MPSDPTPRAARSSIHECPGIGRGCGTAIRRDQELCGFCRQEQRASGLALPAVVHAEPARDVASARHAVERGVAMAAPKPAMNTCGTCEQSFPKGPGRPPADCPRCRGVKTGAPRDRATKPSTALVPRRSAGEKVVVRRGGGAPRPAAVAVAVPLATTREAETLIAELAQERAEIDVVIGFLSRRFRVVAGVGA